MKRDMELVRRTLLEIEGWSWAQRNDSLKMEGYDDQEISYHVKMMYDAGLIDAIDLSSRRGFDWRPTCLTWEGHDFLDAARERTRWEKAKQLVKDKAGTVSFDVFKQLLISLSLKAVGL